MPTRENGLIFSPSLMFRIKIHRQISNFRQESFLLPIVDEVQGLHARTELNIDDHQQLSSRRFHQCANDG